MPDARPHIHIYMPIKVARGVVSNKSPFATTILVPEQPHVTRPHVAHNIRKLIPFAITSEMVPVTVRIPKQPAARGIVVREAAAEVVVVMFGITIPVRAAPAGVTRTLILIGRKAAVGVAEVPVSARVIRRGNI